MFRYFPYELEHSLPDLVEDDMADASSPLLVREESAIFEVRNDFPEDPNFTVIVRQGEKRYRIRDIPTENQTRLKRKLFC